MLQTLLNALASTGFTVLLPTVVLGFLMILALYVLWRAQNRDDFDIANLLKDESGRESALRLGVLVSLAISSWGIVFLLINKSDAINYWFAYLATWSGALVFVKLADKWNGQLPWAKGP